MMYLRFLFFCCVSFITVNICTFIKNNIKKYYQKDTKKSITVKKKYESK